MAAPNIVNVANIYGRVRVQNVTTVSNVILLNSSTSNMVIKVNSLIVANSNGVSSADVTATLSKNQTANIRLAFTVAVPNDATLVLISKDTSIYLEENDSILMQASANNFLEATISYEEIS